MFYNPEKTYYYFGDWVDGERHGKGTYVHKSYSYTGDWVRDEITGFGKMDFQSGCYYEGHFRNNKYDGHGKYVCDNGSEYDGEYKEGKRNGYGRESLQNGDIYEGTWGMKGGKTIKITGTLTRTGNHNCIVKYKDGDVEDKNPIYFECSQRWSKY